MANPKIPTERLTLLLFSPRLAPCSKLRKILMPEGKHWFFVAGGLPAGVAVWGSPGGFLQLKGTNIKKRLMSHVPTEFHKGAAKFRGAVLFELSWRIVGAGC